MELTSLIKEPITIGLKSYDNQIVVAADIYIYIYKVYRERPNQRFNSLIRQTLASIYKEWGLHWELQVIQEQDWVYTVEQRQRVDLVTSSMGTPESLFLQQRELLAELERRLHFPIIRAQLMDTYNLSDIKLARDCIFKHENFGVYDGHLVLLDDSDFFLAPIVDNKWANLRFTELPTLTLDSKDFVFAPLYLFDKDPVTNLGNWFNRWTLFTNCSEVRFDRESLLDFREQQIDNMVNALHTGNIKNLYVEATKFDTLKVLSS